MNDMRITSDEFEDMKNGSEVKELAAIVNNGCAHEAPSARLFEVCGRAVLVFDDGSDTIHEVLDEVPSDAAGFLRDIVGDYISENITCRNERSGLIAGYEWGLRSVEGDAVPDDHVGEVFIVEVRKYNDGHEGISFVTKRDVEEHHDGRKVHVFADRATAICWIAEQEEGVYRQGHNECGRPNYYVIAA